MVGVCDPKQAIAFGYHWPVMDLPLASAKPAPRSGSARRQELLDIAAEVFAAKGIAHTTVRDIAEEGGILSGSLYHHFVSKDQMVVEILVDGLSDAHERDAGIIAGASDPAEAMHQLIRAFIGWIADEPAVARILLNDRQYITETPELRAIQARRSENVSLWIELAREGIESGVFSASIDAEVVVRAIFDGMLAAVRWLPPRGSSTPEEIGRQLADFYLAGLRLGA